MFQMNAQHAGLAPYAGPRQANVIRTFSLPAPQETPAPPPMDVQSEAAIGPDGTIYLGNFPGYLVALRDPGSGDSLELAWRFHPQGASSWHQTPALAQDGTVYIGFSTGKISPDARGTFYALKAPSSGTDAQVVWSYDFGPQSWRQTSSPIIGPDGTIYVTNGVGKLYAFDPSGKPKWTAQTGTNIQASPALAADGTVYVASMDGKLYAVTPPAGGSGDGAVRWTFEFNQHLGPTPFPTAEGPYPSKQPFGANGIGTLASPTIGPDGTIYVGANNSNFYAIGPDGSPKWLYEAEREIAGIASTAALSADGKTVYFGANKGGIYALNTQDGSKRWQFNIYGSIDPSPSLDSKGWLYTGSTIGHVFALDANSGQQQFDFDAGATVWTAPAIRPDGSLVVATRKGKVLLFAAQ